MNYDQLSRVALLKSLYDKMSDEDKRLFVSMHLNGKSNNEIVEALNKQSNQLTDIREHQQSWLGNFGANIAGNAAYDAALWLLGRIIKVIK